MNGHQQTTATQPQTNTTFLNPQQGGSETAQPPPGLNEQALLSGQTRLSKEQLKQIYDQLNQFKAEGKDKDEKYKDLYRKLATILKVQVALIQQQPQQQNPQQPQPQQQPPAPAPQQPQQQQQATFPQQQQMFAQTAPMQQPTTIQQAQQMIAASLPIHAQAQISQQQQQSAQPIFTAKQKEQLKAQIYCLKYHILKRTPVPAPLLQAVRGGDNVELFIKEYERVHMQKELGMQQPAPAPAQQPVVQPVAPPVVAQQIPAAIGNLPNGVQQQAIQKLARLYTQPNASIDLSAQKPIGLDFQSLYQERDRRIQHSIRARFEELKKVLHTGNHAEKLKAVVEVKKLQLLSFQKVVRGEMLMERKAIEETNANSMNLEERAKQNRLGKRQDNQKMRADKGRNQRHLKFLNDVANHRKKLKDFFKNQARKTLEKVNKECQTYFERKARAERERREKQEKARLKALKENDEEAYIKLLKDAKIDRLTELIKQTDECLRQLGAQLVSDRDKQEEGAASSSAEGFSLDGDDANAAAAAEGGRDIYADFIRNQKAYYKIAHTLREKIDKQPKILKGGDLKPYQLQGLQWLVSLYNNRLNGILADEMGLGKTIQTISLVSYLYEVKNNKGPHLIIVPLSTIENWSLEFEKWAPEIKVVKYGGKQQERKELQKKVLRTRDFDVLLCQFEFITRDKTQLKKIDWEYIIIDEGHRIKNSHCKLVLELAKYRSKNRLLLTGTPLQNDLKELWSLLHFLLPKIFDSSGNFENWFSTPFNNIAPEKVTVDEEEKLLIISRLHQVLRPFLLRREKSEVETQLPEKVEHLIRCDMSALQKRLYRQIQGANRLMFTDESKAKSKSLNNSIMQLRKVCNHPYLFFSDSEGFSDEDLIRTSGKFEVLDRILPKMKATGHRILIFSQMTNVLDLLAMYMQYKGYEFLRLDGNVKAEERGDLVKNFNKAGSPYFVFLLSTRSGGLGLNLQTADTVIIFDSDWNPQQDLQAQARAHRIGQTKSVRVFIFVTASDVEEKIYRRAQEKKEAEAKIIRAGKFNQRSTFSERQEFLSLLLRKEDEFAKFDIPDAEQLNRYIARSEEEFEAFMKMDLTREEEDKKKFAALGLPVPARLMTEPEIPAWIPAEGDVPTIDEAEEAAGRGRGMRNRGKRIVYDEKQLDDLIDGDDDENGDQKSEEDTLDEDEEMKEEEEEEQPKKRGRGRQKAAPADKKKKAPARQTKSKRKRTEEEDEDEEVKIEEEEEEEETSGRRSKRARKNPPAASKKAAPASKRSSRATPKAAASKKQKSLALAVTGEESYEDIESTLGTPFQKQCWLILEKLATCADGSGRLVSELFLQLPEKQMYPDYYQLIKNPISLEQMELKIRNNEYTSIDGFEKDMLLMCQNAQTYNQETSEVYADSVTLYKLFQKEKTKLAKPQGSSSRSQKVKEELPSAGVFKEEDLMNAPPF